METVFSNVLTKGQIEEMASVDEFEVVKEVQVSYDRLSVADSRNTSRTTWRNTRLCLH